jgi:SNF2 family DNA or RNA helicase
MEKELPELFPHQKEAVERFVQAGVLGCWHDAGTGKTRTAVDCVRFLVGQFEDLRGIIFTPNSVQEEWVKNFRKWYESCPIPVTILRGSGAKKAYTVNKTEGSHIYIVNYEALDNDDLKQAIVDFDPHIKIADEVHRIKNYRSKRSQFFVKLPTRYRLALTGTLESNGYEDLYMPFRFLQGNIFPGNYNFFLRTYFENENAGNRFVSWPAWKPKPESVTVFERMKLELGTVVKKTETLKLPPLLHQYHYVDLHRNIVSAYRDMERDYVAWFDSDEGRDAVSAQLAITKTLRLRQITCGVLQGDNTVECVHQEKDAVLGELLTELAPHNKVVVWATFRPCIDSIKKVVLGHGFYERNFAVITGGQTSEERNKEIDRFKNELQCGIMIANPKAGGTGIDGLQVASYAIYYNKDFSYVDYQQSLARTYRSGSEQHQSVTVIHLVTRDTIEEVVEEALDGKDKLQEYDVARLLRERYGNKKRKAA